MFGETQDHLFRARGMRRIWNRPVTDFSSGWASHGMKSVCAGLLLAAFAGWAGGFPQHPFLLANEHELAAVRAELAQSGWKTKLYRAAPGAEFSGSACGVGSNAERWLKQQIVIPARGGHYHNYFCDDGTRLELPGEPKFVPGPYRCPACGRQYSGERYEGALRRTAHAWLAQAARDLALVYALEQRPDCAAKAAEILDKYADAYPGPHTGHTTGGIQYQSLCESMWVIPLAQAFDLIHPALTEPQRAKIAGLLTSVAGGLRRCGARGNWGSWHLSAVGVVGYATEDRELVEWATGEFKRQIRDELGEDGLWPESVHTYHYFPLQAFAALAEAAWHAGDDLYHWEARPGKSLCRMFTAPLDYAYPNLRLPAINDGWFESFVPPDLYELAQRRAPDSRFPWLLAHSYQEPRHPAGSVEEANREFPRNGIYAFLFGTGLTKAAPPPAPRSVNFPGLGIAILRSTNGAMMTFDYGPLLSHGQRDKMGITLFAGNKLWVADYGTPGYGAPILPWYTTTFSHNTVVVDGEAQQPTKDAAVELSLGGPEMEWARSRTTQAYPGTTHTRLVMRAGDCFVVRDQLESASTHAYDLYLRAEGRLSLENTSGDVKPDRVPAQWIETPRAHLPQPELSGQWSDGPAALAFWVRGTGPVIPIQAQCPAETGSRKLDLLIARQSGARAEFVTVLWAGPANDRLRVESTRDRLLVRRGGETRTFTFP